MRRPLDSELQGQRADARISIGPVRVREPRLRAVAAPASLADANTDLRALGDGPALNSERATKMPKTRGLPMAVARPRKALA
jgi:hypothetical protein